MNFTFAHPWLLLLLLVIPVLAWFRGKRGRQPAFLYSSVQLVKGIIGITKSSAGSILPKMRWFVLALFIFALAQPRFVQSETKVSASGVDIVVALDMSGSMLAEDEGFVLNGQQATRFIIARDVLKKFVDKRQSDRIGLVVFGTQAYVAVPPTLDHEFLLKNLERLGIGSINGNQTAIGSALSTSMNRLRELKSKSKIIILMTDGQNNAGKVPPLTAAEAARALGIKIYTIGVGTKGVARMAVGTDPFSGQKIYQQVPVDIDEGTLTSISKMTNAKYYRADSTATLEKIYADIDRLEKTEAEVKKYTQFQELFAWFVIPGMFLLLLEVILSHTIWRKLP
ncbi:vWA domain-containing protein [Pedosphaera parvula]|uniref:von Willebrand factor type A n=1 Tax=Pedosphaera parvula (strain Ellin514) TaxID=320771 RepID=B9XFD0_PEDPL|nr:VWA domain-containing protein [Pedosphaera parvula]EEF61294.1 von Willebrand factor type A [Pedosphaera parvula Ellin514]